MPTKRKGIPWTSGHTLSEKEQEAVDAVRERVQTALEVKDEFRWALRWEPPSSNRPVKRRKPIENILRYRSAPWSHCYEKLIGAAYSLIEAAKLIDVPHVDYNDQPRHTLLGPLIEDTATAGEAARADTWRAGYYLGNAQARVAAVLDGLVNVLLRLHITHEHPSHEGEWFHLWIGGRLLFASRLVKLLDLRRELLRMHGEFDRIPIDTAKAAAALAHHNRRPEPIDLVGTLSRYPQRCAETFLPLCIGRNNAFKHLPEGTATVGTRGQRARLHEFGCTLVAFETLAKLWVLCLKEAILVGDDGARTRPPPSVRKKKAAR
jgi:hypothetical protein